MREKRGRPVDRFRTLSAAVAALAMAGCEPGAWAAANSAADAAMVVAGEARALASRVASDAEVDDGDSLAERAFDSADAARAAQAETRAWRERDSVDPALLEEAFRITDAAWEQAVTTAAEAAAHRPEQPRPGRRGQSPRSLGRLTNGEERPAARHSSAGRHSLPHTGFPPARTPRRPEIVDLGRF